MGGYLGDEIVAEPLVLVSRDWLLTLVTGPGPEGNGWGFWMIPRYLSTWTV
jgi:hypothetical protein